MGRKRDENGIRGSMLKRGGTHDSAIKRTFPRLIYRVCNAFTRNFKLWACREDLS